MELKRDEKQVEISDHTENFELDDNTSLAKWSSLDLLAEEDDSTSPTVPDLAKGMCLIFSILNYRINFNDLNSICT